MSGFGKYVLFFVFCFLQISLWSQKEEVIIDGIYAMPESSVASAKKDPFTNDGVREDLHKFMGYENIPTRYISIPYDVGISANIDSFFTDIGFLLLLIFPILFLLPSGKNDTENAKYGALINWIMMLAYVFLLIVSISGAYLHKNNVDQPEAAMNLLTSSSPEGSIAKLNHTITQLSLKAYAPIYSLFSVEGRVKDVITYPILLFVFIALFFVINARIKGHDRVSKGLIFFIAVYLFLWWVLGAGAAWYGILLFSIPYVFMLKSLSRDRNQKPLLASIKAMEYRGIRRGLLLLTCMLWLLMAFVFRSTNYNPVNVDRAKHIYIPPIMEYQTGKFDEKKLMDFHFPQIYEIKKILNQEDESLIYRVGTRINYFVRKNDRRVFNDTFLNFFNQLVQQFKKKQKIIKILRMEGYKYIVLDLNLADNDYTPEKSLTRKYTQLLNTLYNNPKVELLLTDRTIQLNNTGQIVNAVFEDQGNIINRGSIALFRIKP